MSEDDGASLRGTGRDGRDRLQPALTPARLRAMAAWFREFAALASAEQRHWQMQLAGYYERLADEREAGMAGVQGGEGAPQR
jgi:hypothetical protein